MIKDKTMIATIKEQLKDKILEIGFNYNPNELWTKEMIYIDGDYWGEVYLYFDCMYFSENESDGYLSFKVGFLRNDIFLEYVDTDAEIHIILN